MTIDPIHVTFRYADVPMEKIGAMMLAGLRKPRPMYVTVFRGVIIGVIIGIGLNFFPVNHAFLTSTFLMICGAALAFVILVTATKVLQKRIYAAMQFAPFRSGKTETILDQRGVHVIHQMLTQNISWSAIIDVATYPGFTLLKPSPYEYYPIPHASLPPGLTPEALHTQIAAWRATAA